MSALANTLSCSDLKDYRYQPGRTGKHSIYVFGDDYFCASKTEPKWKPGPDCVWEKFQDQFWAEKAKTVVWVCRVSETVA